MRYTDDYMDELFRRAAENYPLNTNSADWDKVAEKLNPPENIDNHNKRSFNAHLLWILLLIPLTFICYQLDLGSKITVHQNGLNGANKNQPTNALNKNLSEEERNVNSMVTEGGENTRSNKTYSDNLQNSSISTNKNYQNINGRIPGNQITNTDPGFLDAGLQTSISNNQTNYSVPLLPDYLKNLNYNSQININSVNPGPSEQRIVKKETKPQNRSREHLYTGILAGVGYSKVKDRWSTNPDISAGILLGFSFTNRWAIESGIYYDKKYYSSEGKYLNTAKLNIPANSEITDVDGNCKMIEVPLSIKYNIKKGNNSWFVTSGVSTYFMKHENYDYTAFYTSSGQYMRHHKSYENSTNNWLSVFQISAGYSKKLGNLGSLRIEPNFKFPLQGLGIGQLPVSSMGIQIGLTRTVF